MRKLATSFVAFVAALIIVVVPAGAITNGQADAGEHPYVGELIFFDADFIDSRFDDPGGWFSCSATMLSSTVIVTAGHCTYGVGLNGESTTTGGATGPEGMTSGSTSARPLISTASPQARTMAGTRTTSATSIVPRS
jgi:hypothetical protein